MQKGKGLRRRWLINTAGMICALGLICVVLVTVLFGGYYYSAMESDMRMRVEIVTGVLESVANQDDDEFYQSCITYVQTFEKQPHSELQFINASGVMVASSYGIRTEQSLELDDVMDALSDQESHRYIGRDPMTGEHIMAVSGPLFYADGELAGVVRFLTSTWEVHRQIAIVACISFAVLLIVLAVALLSGNYYLKYILASLSQIVDKAKMIANGSYGIQIQTQYDDEIGDAIIF